MRHKNGKETIFVKQTESIAKEDLQSCLNIFKNALWTSQDDIVSIQDVKGHLFHRRFVEAFSKPEYLRAYALRWSASRALAYAQVFKDLDIIDQLQTDESKRVLCIGGGAGAELVSLAAWLKGHSSTSMHIQLVDIADWSMISESLYRNITAPPELSQYASSAARSRNTAFLSLDHLEVVFTQSDVLSWDHSSALRFVTQCDLVTIMFTLNELYTTSVQQTRQFLTLLTQHTKPGACLLIVDSPGSYSTVILKGTDRRYPMHWLLDHSLLGSPKETSEAARWTKLMSDESRWARLPDGLQHPVNLEDMRYQIHLYQRSGADG